MIVDAKRAAAGDRLDRMARDVQFADGLGWNRRQDPPELTVSDRSGRGWWTIDRPGLGRGALG
ncbi:MAG: hypothetical protein ACTHOJ_12685 [Sphingomonas oligoaromativorans]